MSAKSNAPEQKTLALDSAEDDYEVITSEEVDRVLDGLDQLIAAAQSENIRAYLEEAADNIYSLVYGEDDELDEKAETEQDEAA